MNKPKCSKCESTLIYLRIGTNERVCRTCGYVEKIKDEQSKLKEDLI